MIIERVRAGMANAKAKGKRIGRVKKRNSVLIRSLIEAKLSYREIARISKASHGSVHAEVVAIRKEKAEEEKRKFEAIQESIKANSNTNSIEEMKRMDVDLETIEKVKHSLEETAKQNVANIQGQYFETYD